MKKLKTLLTIIPAIFLLAMLPKITSYADSRPVFAYVLSYDSSVDSTNTFVVTNPNHGEEYRTLEIIGLNGLRTTADVTQDGDDYTVTLNLFAFDENSPYFYVLINEHINILVYRSNTALSPGITEYVPGSSLDFIAGLSPTINIVDAYTSSSNPNTTVEILGMDDFWGQTIRVNFAEDETADAIDITVNTRESDLNLDLRYSTTIFRSATNPETDSVINNSGGSTNSGKTEAQVIDTGYAKFLEDTLDIIDKADGKTPIVIEAEQWVSFPKYVYEKLNEKNSVDITINYKYKGIAYTVTIPAGSDLLSLLDENGYCGFRYLDKVFGGSTLVK